MYRLPDRPVIARLEREGCPLEPFCFWLEDGCEEWEDYREKLAYGEERIS